jgi:hypothetical protein
MQRKNNHAVCGSILSLLIIVNVLVVKIAFVQNEKMYWALVITLPLLMIAISDVRQTKRPVLRSYPLVGHLRCFR